MNILEASYDNLLETIFSIISPFKKRLIKTQCLVHKYINSQAVKILSNDNYIYEFNFYTNCISQINKGAVWADQDFKSSSHFYNPYKKKGLYGRKNAMDLGVNYYNKAKLLWENGKYDKALFYLGASLHIVQDMTIPQHANIRLLDNHRQYETFVKRMYQYVHEFRVSSGSYLLDSIENFIRFNARTALKIHKKYKDIEKDEERFFKVTKCSLPLAKRTSAGLLLLFYKEAIGQQSDYWPITKKRFS